MKQVALTGSVGSGKSTLTDCFRKLGCDIWDADHCVHQLESPGGSACDTIRHLFGPEVMLASGGVDRSALARLVFQDEGLRRRLEDALYPAVQSDLDAWFGVVNPSSGAKVKIATIPLLFEKGWDRLWPWDAIVCVHCTAETQWQRLTALRGWTPDEARLRMAAQWPADRKAALSDYVVQNDGDRSALQAQAEQILRLIVEKDA